MEQARGRVELPVADGHVVIVAQAFKQTFSASEVGSACEAAVAAVGGRPVVLLGSDGGDGLLEALGPTTVKRSGHVVTGPLGAPVDAAAGWLDRQTAVVESRLVCGLSILSERQRDPLRTTTSGLGELIVELVAQGATRIFVGLGGSATMDGGVGMARVWGWTPYGSEGVVLPDGGGALVLLERLDPGAAPDAELIGLADVRNSLTGPEGARVYAAQKGASSDAEEILARGLDRLVAVTRSEGSEELASRPGAGAAGGLGFGIMCFARGKVRPGAPWVLDRIGFDRELRGASAVLTGEGSFDSTSLEGKLTGEVLRRAQVGGVPVALLAPTADSVPSGVVVESGGGTWDMAEVERRARRAVHRVLRLPL